MDKIYIVMFECEDWVYDADVGCSSPINWWEPRRAFDREEDAKEFIAAEPSLYKIIELSLVRTT